MRTDVVSIWRKPDSMSRSQFRILEALASSDTLEVLSPAVLAKNLSYSRAHVSRQLGEMSDDGLVEQVENGYYRITEDGREVIEA